jgi:hypothetical protein
MLGVVRAVAIVVCLTAFVASINVQPRVDPRNSYERILVILPTVGSGTVEDPIRPMFIPSPRSATPNLLSIPAGTPAPVPATPGTPDTSALTPPPIILGYTFVLSDDGKLALTEIVMRDRSGFQPILATPGLTTFLKGVNTRQDIETEFRKYKKDFDASKFGVYVR